MNTPIRRILFILFFFTFWRALSSDAPYTQSVGERRVRIGLALSGGGARGAAHIGVLKVLAREGIQIDCIAGSSFGAIVGGLFAAGYSAEEIEKIIASNWQEVLSNQPERAKAPLVQGKSQRQLAHIDLRGFNPTLPVGFLRGQRLIELTNRYTVEQMLAAGYDFDRLPIRFRAVSTDLLTGRPYIFKNGRMSEALRASSSLPLIFTPWPKDGMLLVDGSMSNNLPTDIVRDMGADIVIAVDVTAPDLKSEEIRNFLSVYDLNGYSNSSYSRMREIVAQGASAAGARLPDIRAQIGNRRVNDLAYSRIDDTGPVIDSVSFKTTGASHPENHTPAYLIPKVTSKPSDTIQPERLAVDTRRLYASGLFENVDYELRRVEDNRYHLQYQLIESSPNTLGLSMRYSTDYRLQALAKFSLRGLFGSPSSATISGRFGSAAYQNAASPCPPAAAFCLSRASSPMVEAGAPPVQGPSGRRRLHRPASCGADRCKYRSERPI
jgi:NTE family protein